MSVCIFNSKQNQVNSVVTLYIACNGTSTTCANTFCSQNGKQLRACVRFPFSLNVCDFAIRCTHWLGDIFVFPCFSCYYFDAIRCRFNRRLKETHRSRLNMYEYYTSQLLLVLLLLVLAAAATAVVFVVVAADAILLLRLFPSV